MEKKNLDKGLILYIYVWFIAGLAAGSIISTWQQWLFVFALGFALIFVGEKFIFNDQEKTHGKM